METSNRINGLALTPAGRKVRLSPPKKPARPRLSKKAKERAAALRRFQTGLTVALGVAIPALSLTLSRIAGTLASQGVVGLASLLAGVGVAVLAVSLSHLAEAIGHCTGARPWQAWLLATTLDLSIVGSELIGVVAPKSGLDGWALGLMLVVGAFSMALNVYAFLLHRR